MLLERRTVSRKTAGDGRLEISREAADRLRSRGDELEVECGGELAAARVETMACACAKAGAPHEHHFVASELLKRLRADEEVELRLEDGTRGEARGARLAVCPVR